MHICRSTSPLSFVRSVKLSAGLSLICPTYRGACNMQHAKLKQVNHVIPGQIITQSSMRTLDLNLSLVNHLILDRSATG